ncbi:hypothetical protein [Streptomyces sp. MAA16]|uniref:hypothetical protein n=1 Tax=Streptomyces sp. MAA16 TaxID=3035116 RepID=UPI0024738AC5|nr:hypothetical protein [Streptomyces sp. MAA16]MDH6699523.1 hypothetical protein [Streptomyces sp. MAA16]
MDGYGSDGLPDVVRTGDSLVCEALLSPATGKLTVPPTVPLSGTGAFRVQGGTVCVPSDIPSLQSVSYVAEGFPTAGTGTVTFDLKGIHRTGKLRTGGLPVVVNGGPVDFHFVVTIAASNPQSQDLVKQYQGRARLQCADRTVHAGHS